MKGVRVFDFGERAIDRYTAVFPEEEGGRLCYLAMSDRPSSPQGFGQHGEILASEREKGFPSLGKEIPFESLPPDCKRAVLQDLEV